MSSTNSSSTLTDINHFDIIDWLLITEATIFSDKTCSDSISKIRARTTPDDKDYVELGQKKNSRQKRSSF